jgi:hypothetical protein
MGPVVIDVRHTTPVFAGAELASARPASRLLLPERHVI